MVARSRLHLLAVLAIALPLRAGAGDAKPPVDPYFREALYHAHQGDFFAALERLDAELAQHYGVDERPLDSLYPYVEDAEFSVGDFELEYRMHLRAGRAIRAVLEGDVDEKVRNDAAYRLARLYFEKSQPDTALTVLDSIRGETPDRLAAEIPFLRANVLLALDRPDDAVAVLRKIENVDSLTGFSTYNLGIALLESGHPVEAARELDRAGRVSAADRDTKAIRDKANLVLGTLLFEADQVERARATLERVRLEGPFSNQALLRAGWAEADIDEFERAVVPWSVLVGRDATDPAVQEAKLALPYAYSRLAVHGRAAVLYQQAVETFEAELRKLDASIESIEKGRFLEALEREEIKQDRDWVVRLRNLPEAPETFYLVSLMASHDFQTALQNYLDLTDLRRTLLQAETSFDAFDDLIAKRSAYYEPRLPEIDRDFRRLDAKMRLRLTQREHLARRLERMLRDPSPELLATAEEHADLEKLAGIRERLASRAAEPGVAPLLERVARLEGLLRFRLETEYHERLTAVNDHLLALDADVAALEARHAEFVRVRQAATHSYVGYDQSISGLRERAVRALDAVDSLKTRQGEHLEAVAVEALRARREQLAAYQNQARFAFADSYDSAAKHQAAR
ncbi:MAG: tetratricopeptide repeat protein [Deltaproteobacteria bacterium]|nr:tetratricopeptide repeat protein [Deltaproteobacteria bacterium]